MRKRRVLVRSLLLGALLCLTVTANAQSSRGGGAFLWYNSQSPTGTPDCYGVIKNYDNPTAKSQILATLQAMYNNGQRKLTAQVYHHRGAGDCGGVPGANGVNMNSDYQNYEWQYITNLQNYLTDAKAIGFDQLELIMSPAVDNWPRNWPSYQWGIDNYYHFENWYTIAQARQAAVNAGIPFIIILADEVFLHGGFYPPMNAYVHDIWQWYLQTYGVTQGRNEAGFTMSCIDEPGLTPATTQLELLINEIDHVGLGRPTYWALNFFKYHTDPTTRTNATWSGFIACHDKLAARGAWEPIVVTSTFYNDYATAYGLRAASNYKGRPISFLMQWPLTTAAGFDTWTTSPQDFGNYISLGF